MLLDRHDAQAIAKKLQATVEAGRKNDLAVITFGGKHICQFGIRRGSKSLPHPHIASQLFVSNRQAQDLARCPMSFNGWIALMKQKGKILEDLTPWVAPTSEEGDRPLCPLWDLLRFGLVASATEWSVLVRARFVTRKS